ncbi:MAG: hypothetical protein EBT04_06310 [Betaproteobacteria bacterium]|nr:hypothetical protein [Betaproteobacteria bacterium]
MQRRPIKVSARQPLAQYLQTHITGPYGLPQSRVDVKRILEPIRIKDGRLDPGKHRINYLGPQFVANLGWKRFDRGNEAQVLRTKPLWANALGHRQKQLRETTQHFRPSTSRQITARRQRVIRQRPSKSVKRHPKAIRPGIHRRAREGELEHRTVKQTRHRVAPALGNSLIPQTQSLHRFASTQTLQR